jgi:hypothetical protein
MMDTTNFLKLKISKKAYLVEFVEFIITVIFL